MIGVGDKVMVVYCGCMHGMKYIGKVFVVGGVLEGVGKCDTCGASAPFGPYAVEVPVDGLQYGWPIRWLSKIDPDAEHDGRERKREIVNE